MLSGEALPYQVKQKNQDAFDDLGDILLKVSDCVKYKLCDDIKSELPRSHLSFLRFAWANFLFGRANIGKRNRNEEEALNKNTEEDEDDKNGGGFILNHGIGFPKRLLVTLFLQMFCTKFSDSGDSRLCKGKRKRRVLIVATSHEKINWHSTGQKFKSPSFLQHLIPSGSNGIGEIDKLRYKAVQQWGKKGGLLVITYREYVDTIDAEVESPWSIDAKFSIINGPDIVVVDEGSHLSTHRNSSILQFYASKFKIVLTSLPISSNLQVYSNLVNWIFPNLLYSTGNISLYHLYLKNIINGHRLQSTQQDGKICYDTAFNIYKKLKYITFSTHTGNIRSKELLFKKKILLESCIQLNLSTLERKA